MAKKNGRKKNRKIKSGKIWPKKSPEISGRKIYRQIYSIIKIGKQKASIKQGLHRRNICAFSEERPCYPENKARKATWNTWACLYRIAWSRGQGRQRAGRPWCKEAQRQSIQAHQTTEQAGGHAQNGQQRAHSNGQERQRKGKAAKPQVNEETG